MLKDDRATGARPKTGPGVFIFEDGEPIRIRTCRSCSASGPETMFSRAGGQHINTCKTCIAAQVRARRAADPEKRKAQDRARYAANIEAERERNRNRKRAKTPKSPKLREQIRRGVAKYVALHPDRDRARRTARRAIKRGKIVRPSVCEALGCHCTGPLAGHHHDYKNKLLVTFLCAEHHVGINGVHRLGKLKLKPSAKMAFTYAPPAVGAAPAP